MPDIHHVRMLEAGRRLGLEVEELPERGGRSAARYRDGEREAVVLDGRVFPGLSEDAERLADDKPACKEALDELGIPTPYGIVFDDPQAAKPEIEGFLRGHAPAVCKPAIGTHGDGVALDLLDTHAVIAHARRSESADGRYVLEEQAPGSDLRLQAIGRRLVAACAREPATLTGDGEHRVRELIALTNCKLAENNPANRIVVDDQTEALLVEAELTLDDVPARGRRIPIKRVANIAQGGAAIDVTAALHPRYRDWVAAIGGRLGLDIFSVDLMTVDPESDPIDASTALEVNARPEWVHHTFSEGRTHDIARLLLDHLLR